MKNNLFVLILSLLALPLTVLGQPFCTVRTFNVRDGLAANFISGFGQTGDGRMWVTTWNGLSCYDGYQFTTFRSLPGADEVLTTNRIIRMETTSRDDIWCITYDRYLYLYDTHQCRFVNVTDLIEQKYGLRLQPRNIYSMPSGHTWITCEQGQKAALRVDDSQTLTTDALELFWFDRHGLDANYVKKVVEDADGRDWMFTDAGIILLDGDFASNTCFEYLRQMGQRVFLASADGHIVSWQSNGKEQPVALPDGVSAISGMEQQGDNVLVLGTNAGLVFYDVAHNRARLQSVQSPSQPSADVVNLHVDDKGRVWAFTGGDGIVMCDSLGCHWLQAQPAKEQMRTTSSGYFWMEDAYHTVWTIPQGGTFCYYDEMQRSLVPYQLQSVGYEYANLSYIDKYTLDNQRNLWFSSAHDLSLVNFRFHNLKFVPVRPNEETRAIAYDHDGRLWVGCANGCVAVYAADGSLQGYIDGDGRLQQSDGVRFSDRIYAITEDSRHRMWIGTKGQGLFRIDAPGSVSHYMPNDSDSYSLSHMDVYTIDQDERGHIWVGTYEAGLNLVDERQDGTVRFYNYRNMFSTYKSQQYNKIRRITHDGRGTVLLSTTGGLVTFSNRFKNPSEITFYDNTHVVGDTTTLHTVDVLQTCVTREGRTFVATMGGGLQEVVGSNLLQSKLTYRRMPQFAPSEGNVLSMVEDNSGHLWVVRETTIDRYDPSTGEFMQFGPNALGDRMEFSEALPAVDRQRGSISIGSLGGYVSFQPQVISKNDYVPRVVFTSVSFQGDTDEQPLLNMQELRVPSDRRNFTIRFAAVDFTNNYLVRYAYKLEGVDNDWTYVGMSHQASFNHIPAGRHRLLVRSTNVEGVWVDNETVLVIDAQPTFWESIWGQLLKLLIVAAIVALFIHIYRLRQRARMEREMGQMKSQFYSDVSHKLRTPLTLIGGPVGEVLRGGQLSGQDREHLEMVHRNAENMLGLVDDMLRYSQEHGVYISDVNAASASDDNTPEADRTQDNADSREADGSATERARLLIVEDNADLRAFLCSILSTDYQVLQAENGRIGLEMAERDMPDFIITDVMMPEMDGLTMVHRIKQNKDTCHIPIVVLSAKASLDDRLQGLREGIDDYITKPFSATYLKQRVENIIGQRRMLQQSWLENLAGQATPQTAESPSAQPAETARHYSLSAPQIVDTDQQMMEQLMGYLEQHIGDANLKIEDLATAVNMGRSVFYGKIKSIVGMTPVDFLRHIRIQRAEQYVLQSSYPFSQIAYMVGFSDPKYFSKCFKKETGMTPSEYRERAGADDAQQ